MTDTLCSLELLSPNFPCVQFVLTYTWSRQLISNIVVSWSTNTYSPNEVPPYFTKKTNQGLNSYRSTTHRGYEMKLICRQHRKHRIVKI